jgi:hypothetical protein
MSYKTATLTDVEVNAISDPSKPYLGASRELKSLSGLLHADEDEFFIALRIINTLWGYEERAKMEPSMEVLAVLLNGEYRLWRMTEGVDININPFLTHWVEAVMRMDAPTEQSSTITGNTTNDSHKTLPGSLQVIRTRDIFRIGAAFIKGLIQGRMRGMSPEETLQQATRDDSFDIRRYMQILVDTGVWSDSEMPKTPKPEPTSNGNAPHESWQQVILRKLKEQPEVAVDDIVRLPLQLEHLEFLNKLLTHRTLESHSLEPSSVITPYIQHALRLVETMGAPPIGSVDGMENGGTMVEYGKEAQRRAVNLLLLFIKNLILKDLLGTQSIYFEIEEICVRYVWIKEVRDFRSWIEEGRS